MTAADASSADSQSLDSTVSRLLFGDRHGVVLFLATVCGLALVWRAGVFITDTQTLIATLDAVSSGHLWIDEVTGNHIKAPGAVVFEGLVYGRNYGQVFLALPFLWALEGIQAVADLRVALTAVWHVLLLVLVVQLGRLFGIQRLASFAGSAVVLASLLVNIALARQFSAVQPELLALQFLGLVCAGFLAALVYRLVRRSEPVRVAVFAGAAASLVLPVGFWAPIPKRHVLVATILVALLYAFARSRTNEGLYWLPWLGPVPVFRGAAYVLVGLLAWIHAAEAIFVFLALVLVDLPTAPKNDSRTLVFLSMAFFLSLVPFFVTNGLITGDPLQPPRTLTPADATNARFDALRTSSEATSGGGGGGVGALPGYEIFEKILWIWVLVWGQASESLAQFRDLDAVIATWFRSGSLESLADGGLPEFRAINLSVFESAPILAGIVATIGSAFSGWRSALRDRITPTDALATGLILAFVLLYMQRLPIHVQVTVRYLLPMFPVALYLCARQAPIERLVLDYRGFTIWSYLAVVLLGTQLVLAYVVAAGLTVSAAAQLHGIFGLAAAGLLAASVLASEMRTGFRPVAAVALGLAAGLGTAFILLSGIAYFSFIGQFVLPISQAVAELIGTI